jgi:hypothetical protein
MIITNRSINSIIKSTLTVSLCVMIAASCTTTTPTKKRRPKVSTEPVNAEPTGDQSLHTNSATVISPVIEPATKVEQSVTPSVVIVTLPPAPAAPLPVAPTPTVPQNPDCILLTNYSGETPVFLPKSKVFLTRVSKPCITDQGEDGFKKTSSWVVMGFPCTGGQGRIDWKGTNYLAPKMVSFLVDTSCAMAPSNPRVLVQSVTTEVGLDATAPMLAFNPFVVQYWEIIDHDDADVSFSVDLRSKRSLGPSWREFQKQKPFKVLMIGRENAWVQGNHMYAVEADVHHAAKNRFTVEVTNARLLDSDELSKIKARCEALRPERECGKVF